MFFKIFLPILLLAVVISQSLLSGGSTNDYAPAWSPDGSRIAFLREEGGERGIYRVNIDSSNFAHQATTPPGAIQSWSPDGKLIAYTDPGIQVMNVESGEVRGISSAESFGTYWSPDSSKIATLTASLGGGGDLFVFDVATGSQVLLARSIVGRPSWSPDSLQVAFSGLLGEFSFLEVVNADGSNRRELLRQPGATDVAWSPEGGRIAFTYYAESSYEIGVINVDSSGFTRLTQSENPKDDPLWSPDGSKILYMDLSRDPFDIYVMNADGSQPHRLTNGEGFNSSPVWSPNSSKIAFLGSRAGEAGAFVMASDGSNLTRITPAHMEPNRLAWTPDGSQIALHGNFPPRPVLYLMNPDGSNVSRLSAEHYVENFAWSPDGQKIAFLSDDLYVINTDSTGLLRLSSDLGINTYAWSPLGNQIAFANNELYVVDSDGSNLERLASLATAPFYGNPVWSPDGTKIAFSTGSIYVVDAGGGTPRQLTQGSDHGKPAWSPDGRKIAFMNYSILTVIDADGGNERRLGQAGDLPGITPAWSPDDSMIIFSNGQLFQPEAAQGTPSSDTSAADPGLTMYVINADGTDQKILMHYNSTSQFEVLPFWSPDSRFIVVSEYSFTYLFHADGSHQHLLTLPDYRDSSPSWAPDGRRLVYAANKDGNSDLHLVSISY